MASLTPFMSIALIATISSKILLVIKIKQHEESHALNVLTSDIIGSFVHDGGKPFANAIHVSVRVVLNFLARVGGGGKVI